MTNTKKVKVAELRNLTDALYRSINVDRYACKGDVEKARWVLEARTHAARLDAVYSPRAKEQDITRKERALDLCTDRILEVLAKLDTTDLSLGLRMALLGLERTNRTGSTVPRWTIVDSAGRVRATKACIEDINRLCDALHAQRYGA